MIQNKKVTNETILRDKVTNERRIMGDVTNETSILFVGLPPVDGWRPPKSQIRMASSDEEDGLLSEVLEDTESDSEDEGSAGTKGKTPRLIPAGASAQYAARIRQEEKQRHRLSKERSARTLDQQAEKEALDAGKLQPRPLSVLKTTENIVHVGQKLSCPEELFVRVSEDCEKVQKFYTARNTGAGGHTTKVGRAGTTSQYVNVVCRDDPECAYSVKASWFEDRSEKHREDAAVGWVVEEYSPHTCQGGAPPKKVSKNKGPSEESNVDLLVRYPPLPPPKVGRPKGTKRVRAHSEDKRDDKQQNTTGRRCGQCKQPGHTKRTCPDLVGTSSRAGQ